MIKTKIVQKWEWVQVLLKMWNSSGHGRPLAGENGLKKNVTDTGDHYSTQAAILEGEKWFYGHLCPLEFKKGKNKSSTVIWDRYN